MWYALSQNKAGGKGVQPTLYDAVFWKKHMYQSKTNSIEKVKEIISLKQRNSKHRKHRNQTKKE